MGLSFTKLLNYPLHVATNIYDVLSQYMYPICRYIHVKLTKDTARTITSYSCILYYIVFHYIIMYPSINKTMHALLYCKYRYSRNGFYFPIDKKLMCLRNDVHGKNCNTHCICRLYLLSIHVRYEKRTIYVKYTFLNICGT